MQYLPVVLFWAMVIISIYGAVVMGEPLVLVVLVVTFACQWTEDYLKMIRHEERKNDDAA
jgi:uncharacterized membrane protein